MAQCWIECNKCKTVTLHRNDAKCPHCGSYDTELEYDNDYGYDNEIEQLLEKLYNA